MESGFSEELYMDDTPVEFFYVWEENWVMYEIFQLMIPYLDHASRKIDTQLLMTLIQEFKAPVCDTIRNIPYIAKGYTDRLFPTQETESKNS